MLCLRLTQGSAKHPVAQGAQSAYMVVAPPCIFICKLLPRCSASSCKVHRHAPPERTSCGPAQRSSQHAPLFSCSLLWPRKKYWSRPIRTPCCRTCRRVGVHDGCVGREGGGHHTKHRQARPFRTYRMYRYVHLFCMGRCWPDQPRGTMLCARSSSRKDISHGPIAKYSQLDEGGSPMRGWGGGRRSSAHHHARPTPAIPSPPWSGTLPPPSWRRGARQSGWWRRRRARGAARGG